MSFGIAPITVVSGSQDFVLIVTDGSGNELPVYLDAAQATRVTQPYRNTGVPSLTVYRPLAAATESATITVLVQGEPTTQSVTLGPAGTTVTLSSAPGSVVNHGGHLGPGAVIDGGGAS